MVSLENTAKVETETGHVTRGIGLPQMPVDGDRLRFLTQRSIRNLLSRGARVSGGIRSLPETRGQRLDYTSVESSSSNGGASCLIS